VSERDVEVPFVLEYAKGPNLLDVGADATGYTRQLQDKGVTVYSCDPQGEPSFQCKFQDLETRIKFDTILFLSSMEHFDISEENLKRVQTEVYCICKCRELLAPDGIVIITVPFGKQEIYPAPRDFIQWSLPRILKIQSYANALPLREEFQIKVDNSWHKISTAEEAKDFKYGDTEANAVYMGVWKV
jgi:hypothetical protein